MTLCHTMALKTHHDGFMTTQETHICLHILDTSTHATQSIRVFQCRPGAPLCIKRAVAARDADIGGSTPAPFFRPSPCHAGGPSRPGFVYCWCSPHSSKGALGPHKACELWGCWTLLWPTPHFAAPLRVGSKAGFERMFLGGNISQKIGTQPIPELFGAGVGPNSCWVPNSSPSPPHCGPVVRWSSSRRLWLSSPASAQSCAPTRHPSCRMRLLL